MEDWRTLTRKSIAELLDEFFESDQIKAPLCTGGVIGVNAGPMTPGTCYVKFHHLIGSIDGHQGAWGFVRGGMGSVSGAIAAVRSRARGRDRDRRRGGRDRDLRRPGERRAPE